MITSVTEATIAIPIPVDVVVYNEDGIWVVRSASGTASGRDKDLLNAKQLFSTNYEAQLTR